MKRKKLEDRNIKLFCDVIFSLFAFIYLYFFQRDLLGMMYAVLPAADFLPFSPCHRIHLVSEKKFILGRK